MMYFKKSIHTHIDTHEIKNKVNISVPNNSQLATKNTINADISEKGHLQGQANKSKNHLRVSLIITTKHCSKLRWLCY